MAHEKFDLRKLERLNDPGRFDTLIPQAMWDALGSPSPEVIIEIGAGTGLFSAAFADMAPGSVVYSVDTEDAMLDWMRENRPQVADGRMVLVRSEEASVPLPDGIADLVVMLNVHHELAEPDAIYAEARRLLRPAGQVLVVDWAPRETPKGPSLAVRVSAEDLVRFLERAGFVSAREHEGLPWHSMVTAVSPA